MAPRFTKKQIRKGIAKGIWIRFQVLLNACTAYGMHWPIAGWSPLSKETGGSAQATLIGGGAAPLSTATLVNGTLIRAIDFDDHLALDPNDGTKLGGHPSDHLAGILTAAEWCNRSGQDIITR
jgi:2-methylcitrate dehydratase PrpD